MKKSIYKSAKVYFRRNTRNFKLQNNLYFNVTFPLEKKNEYFLILEFDEINLRQSNFTTEKLKFFDYGWVLLILFCFCALF